MSNKTESKSEREKKKEESIRLSGACIEYRVLVLLPFKNVFLVPTNVWICVAGRRRRLKEKLKEERGKEKCGLKVGRWEEFGARVTPVRSLLCKAHLSSSLLHLPFRFLPSSSYLSSIFPRERERESGESLLSTFLLCSCMLFTTFLSRRTSTSILPEDFRLKLLKISGFYSSIFLLFLSFSSIPLFFFYSSLFLPFLSLFQKVVDGRRDV